MVKMKGLHLVHNSKMPSYSPAAAAVAAAAFGASERRSEV